MKTVLFALTLISFLSIKSIACDGDPSCPMNKENADPAKRAEMAAFHESMAICLKSEKPIEECHDLKKKHMATKMDSQYTCSEHHGKHKEKNAAKRAAKKAAREEAKAAKEEAKEATPAK